MAKHGPDDEVSFGVELTETGVSGKAKGRALSIFQRWLGSAFAPTIAKNNRAAARERLIGALEQKAIAQLGSRALERLQSDPGAVDALLDAISLPSDARKLENTDAVFGKAIEDLRQTPPTDQQATSGAEEITPEIADRLELYASGATTDEIRERWGRVLAAEIRQPGTFSLKVLRIIDELDSSIPAMFEGLVAHRYEGDCIPRCLSGKLPYGQQLKLVDAGLLHDPGSSGAFQYRAFAEGNLVDGQAVWAYETEHACVTIPRNGTFVIQFSGGEEPIISGEGKAAIPAYLLTSAGAAIISILPPVDNAKRYLSLLRAKVPQARLWKRSSWGEAWSEQDAMPAQPDILDSPTG